MTAAGAGAAGVTTAIGTAAGVTVAIGATAAGAVAAAVGAAGAGAGKPPQPRRLLVVSGYCRSPRLWRAVSVFMASVVPHVAENLGRNGAARGIIEPCCDGKKWT